MSKIAVKKLKLHLWQELLYLLFVMIAPIVIACCEVFSSHNTPFKITFSSIGSILIAVIIVRKFVFKSHIEKLRNKCFMNEHDYEVDVGNKDKLRKTWAIYNMIILSYNAIVIILALVLSWLFISALVDQLISFKGASIIILGSCLLGIILRFIFYSIMTKVKEEQNVE